MSNSRFENADSRRSIERSQNSREYRVADRLHNSYRAGSADRTHNSRRTRADERSDNAALTQTASWSYRGSHRSEHRHRAGNDRPAGRHSEDRQRSDSGRHQSGHYGEHNGRTDTSY